MLLICLQFMLSTKAKQCYWFVYSSFCRPRPNIDASIGRDCHGWNILMFLFYFINVLLGCSSVACGWTDQCGGGSLCCRHHINVWLRVGWSCAHLPAYSFVRCCSHQFIFPCLDMFVSGHSSILCGRRLGSPGHSVYVDNIRIALSRTSLYRRWGRPAVLLPQWQLTVDVEDGFWNATNPPYGGHYPTIAIGVVWEECPLLLRVDILRQLLEADQHD